jgi:UDP-3-O-[3-hydroxymyristoyl] glucosamine N-acyltransferase
LALGVLAKLAGVTLDPAVAADRPIEAAAVLGRADAGAVSFLSDKRHLEAARRTGAGACFVAEKDAELLPDACVALLTPRPQSAWAACAAHLHRPIRIDPSAPAIHPTAQLEEAVSIGPGAVIGAGAQIGARTVIGAGAIIGPGVAIGRDSEIGHRAVIGFALIGDGVSIFAGAAIGEAGFGITAGPRGLVNIPQLGRVILQDGVSIGANACVDRGAYEDTVIGENTKIDNLVQIAHNVTIGRNCVIAAFTGLSGSVKIGDGVQIGGGAGVGDHVSVGDGASLTARIAIFRDVPPGETWAGVPGKPARQFFREQAWLQAAARRKGRGDG